MYLAEEDLDGKQIFNVNADADPALVLPKVKLADTTVWTLNADNTPSHRGIYGIINKPEVLDVNKVWSLASSSKSDLTLTISLGSEQMADGLTAQLLSGSEVVYSKNITGTYPASSQVTISLTGVSTTSEYTLKILARNSNISGTYFEVYSLESVGYVDPSGVPTITTQPVSATYGQGDTPTALSVVAAIPSGHSGTLSYKWYGSSTKNVPTSGEPIGTESSYTPVVTTPGVLYYKVVVEFTDSSSDTSKTVESVVVQVSVNYAIRYFDADGYRMAGMTNTEYDGKSNVDLDPIPKEYQKDGYEAYWTDSVSGSRITTLYPGNTGDVSVRLTYSVITYSIAYNTYMGTNVDSNPVTYTVLDSIQFEDPVKDGNLFGGWYLDSSFTTKVTSNSGLHENLTLYAKWTPLTYTLSLNPEGGIIEGEESSETKNITMSGSDSYTLPAVTYSGKNFVGWNTLEAGTGKTYAPGTILKNLTNTDGDTVTLYAIFTTTASEYKITLDPNGRSWKSSYTGGISKTFVSGTTKFSEILPSVSTSIDYDGYAFAGWYSLPVGGTKISTGNTDTNTITLAKSTILYAQWTLTSYTITYNLNGGTQNGKNLASYNIESPMVNFYDPTKTDHLFRGWYTESGFVNQITEIPAGSTGAKTLYAKWESPISYTIAFNVSGGSSVSNISAKAGVSYTAPTTIKSGSTFNGWNTESDGSGTTYGAGASLKDLTTTSSATVTLYAQWTETPKYIMYALSGGTLPADAPKTYATGAVLLKNPTREGYIFLGWLGSGLSGVTHDVTIQAGSIGDREYIAIWQGKQCEITFSEENRSYTVSLNYGSNILLPTPQQIHEKDFIGWYDAKSTNYVGSSGMYYTVDKSTTLYAKFVADATITLSDGTETIGSLKAAVGSVISLPEAPGVADKILENWYATYSGGTFTNQLGPAGASYTVTANATIYAKYVDAQSVWSVPVYKTADGSSYSVDYTAAVPKGQTMVLPAAASINGYTFDGWYKGTSGALTTYVGMAGEGYVPTDVSTLAPKYTAITTATITFSVDSVTAQTITSAIGSVITLPDGPGVTGKLFAGWYAEAGCTTFEGYAGAPFFVTGTSTLYAKYVVGGGGGSLDSYTVSKDDGSSAKVTMTYTPTVMSGSFSLVYVVPDAGYVVTGVTDTASHSTITKLTDSIYMVSGATDDVSLSASAEAKTVSGVKDLYTLGFSENNGKIGVNVTPDAGKVLPKFKVTANSVEYQIVTVNGKSVTGYKNVTASAEVDAGSEGYSGLLGTGLESGYTLYGTYITYSEWETDAYVDKQSTVQILAPAQI